MDDEPPCRICYNSEPLKNYFYVHGSKVFCLGLDSVLMRVLKKEKNRQPFESEEEIPCYYHCRNKNLGIEFYVHGSKDFCDPLIDEFLKRVKEVLNRLFLIEVAEELNRRVLAEVEEAKISAKSYYNSRKFEAEYKTEVEKTKQLKVLGFIIICIVLIILFFVIFLI